MSLSDDELRQALEARWGSARVGGQPSLAVIARAVAGAAPRRVSIWRRSGARRMAVAASAVLVVAMGVAVALGTRPVPPSTEASAAATPAVPSPSSVPSSTPVPSASPASLVIDGCSDLGFDARRCKAVVARAAEQAEPPVAIGAVTRASLSQPRPDGSLGTFPIADVLLMLDDGTDRRGQVRCGIGNRSDRACWADAAIQLSGGVDHDVPCSGPGGDPGSTCATPVPTPRPASVVGARPLRIPSLVIPIDHLGHYEVRVGDAGLPDGALSERSAALADPRPTTFWIDEAIQLEVRPDDPSRPAIGSVFRKPFKGVEPVHVWLVFDVTEIDPGGTLEVRDIVVR